MYFSLCRVAGGLLAAEAAGNPCLLQHAAAQFQRRGEGPQEAGRSPETQNKFKMQSVSIPTFACFLPAGVDKRDGSDAPDGLQTHQLRARQDDDDAAHGTALQRRFPAALLPVSSYTNTQTRKQCVNDIWCILVKPDIIIIYYTTN